VVVNCSGHTFPVEKHIMDEESVVDVRLSQPSEPTAPLDGLGSALERLDEQVTTIVVIDDSPMDSRLIRRLLQAKKSYRVFEANSAVEGLQIIRDRLPDLVVSDLNMPEMDGFALLEELKKDTMTAQIPVIVVSAKDLTPEDKNRLSSQATSIWAKGAFSTQDLVEHVVETLSKTDGGEELSAPAESEAPTTLPLENDEAKGVRKIVLIEDNPMDARLISRILQLNRPLDVKQVQAGREALRVIREEEPHLIVLDLIIPDMSGFQILEELKKDKELDAIPVIVITSKDLSKEEREHLGSHGVSSMWRKDKLDRKQLVADVESQLE
jgi:CheY-like chemotaxis protein